jgi:hypothetical protein
VPVELRRASTFTHAELAALLTAAYEGYAIPFAVDEPTFAHMVDAFDLDLYEKLGFVRTRELEVLTLERGGSEDDAAEEVPLDVAHRLVRNRRQGEEPWQRADETLAHLASREPVPRGLAAGDAAAIYRPGGDGVGLLQAAGDAPRLQAVISALRARGTVSAVNYPADGPAAAVLRTAGARVALRQYEMVKGLD